MGACASDGQGFPQPAGMARAPARMMQSRMTDFCPFRGQLGDPNTVRDITGLASKLLQHLFPDALSQQAVKVASSGLGGGSWRA